MRTLLIIIGVLLLAAGCSQQGALSDLQKAYPDSEITSIPGHKYDWLIQTPEGDVLYVYLNGTYKFPGSKSEEDAVRVFRSVHDNHQQQD